MRRLVVLVALVVGWTAVGLTLTACGSSAVGNSERVTPATVNGAWPFTVRSGELACKNPPRAGAVTFTASDGTTYWLNRAAGLLAAREGWSTPRPILKHGVPSVESAEFAAVMKVAHALCTHYGKY